MKHTVFILPLLLILSSGCATKPASMLSNHYVSPIPATPTRADRTLSIRVNDLQSNAVDRTMGPLLIPKAIVPLIGLLPTTDGKLVNTIAGPPGMSPTLAADEVEKILTAELQRSGLGSEVSFGGVAKDLDISGQINFMMKVNLHMSGLGIFYHKGVLPMFIFPNASYQAICNAQFEVTATNDQTMLLSKNYVADSGWWMQWPLYNGQRVQSAYGKEVLPQIISQFLADLDSALAVRSANTASPK